MSFDGRKLRDRPPTVSGTGNGTWQWVIGSSGYATQEEARHHYHEMVKAEQRHGEYLAEKRIRDALKGLL